MSARRNGPAPATLAAIVGLIALMPLTAAPPTNTSPQRSVEASQSTEIRIEKNVPATMRDGVVLRADVYRPAAPGRRPALLQRTPYSKNDRGAERRFSAIASRGFVVVVQDTRGRYTSDGVAVPHDEADDGYDSVQWAASLPWVDGRVGMFGGSYLATTQLEAATRQPPALVALFPASSYNRRHDMVFQGGAFYLSDGLGWNLGQAMDVRRRVLTPGVDRDGPIGLEPKHAALFRSTWLWQLPLKSFDELELSRFAPGYRQMLAHPDADAFWDRSDIEAHHDRFLVPAVSPDRLVRHAADRDAAEFRRPARACRERNRAPLSAPRGRAVDARAADQGHDDDRRRRLWPGRRLRCRRGHARLVRLLASRRRPSRGRDCASAAVRDGRKPMARRAGVAARPSPHDRVLPAQRRARRHTRPETAASISSAPDREPSDRYTYDPKDPVPTGESGGYSRAPLDRRTVEQRPDVLVYTSAPLTADLEVTGPLTLTLWIASSARDTDFTGTLVDVFPDGTARALADGILRARYRRGKSSAALLTPGEPTEITIDLGATSNLFRAGHRIRLEVSSSNFPRFDRNPNTGGVFGEDRELLTRHADDSPRPGASLAPAVACRAETICRQRPRCGTSSTDF